MSSNPAADEVSEVLDILRNGNEADFEFVKSVLDGFPGGVDRWLDRRWIINAIDCGSLSSVRWIIRQSVDLAFRDEEGYTPLHAALDRRADDDRYEVLRLLVAAGADVNARGLNDWTPLHMAAFHSDLKAIEILLDAGADPTLRTRIDNYATPDEEASSAEVARFIKCFKPEVRK